MAPRRLEFAQRQMCKTYPPTLVYPMGDPLLCAVGEVKEGTFQQVHAEQPCGWACQHGVWVSLSAPPPGLNHHVVLTGHRGSVMTQLLPPTHSALLRALFTLAWPLWLFIIWTLVCFEVWPGCCLSAVALASLNTAFLGSADSFLAWNLGIFFLTFLLFFSILFSLFFSLLPF